MLHLLVQHLLTTRIGGLKGGIVLFVLDDSGRETADSVWIDDVDGNRCRSADDGNGWIDTDLGRFSQENKTRNGAITQNQDDGNGVFRCSRKQASG